MNDTERILNIGKPITLSGISGEVRVKELSLENTMELVSELGDLYSIVASERDPMESLDENSGLLILTAMLKKPGTLHAVKKIASACTELAPEEFSDLGLKDWMLLVATIKEVIDWEELKNLFFQIVPQEAAEAAIKKRREAS